ncbi:MAG TPA: S49 family peptidase [Candidatus Magasanikbacteria bacterium]|nr:S49 family peptidase [Candidatus Magasanikbacteria bacterium]
MTFLRELARSAAWGLAVLVVVGVGAAISFWVYTDWSMSISDGTCNIAVIPVHDQITSYTYYDEFGEQILSSTLDDFEMMLRAAEGDPNIQGVIVSIDSPGGSPYSGEAMANDLKRSPLISAAVIRDQGLSAGYWAASGADRIFASTVSDVGSIGVTMSYLEAVGQNEDNGLSFIELASGRYKDTGNPDKFLTDEERDLLQESVDKMSQEFIRQIAENRALPLETVTALADGSSMLGSDALAAGLVDQIGDKEAARVWFAEALEMEGEDVVLCE